RFVRCEAFRPERDKALARKARDKGGRPPFDAVLMVKIPILQALYTTWRTNRPNIRSWID
ncbi:MAG TPA: hypothetical protein VHT02_10090, partial [Methylocella sp.]|nr:hypothetical protein [Methylocella sp.]